MDPAPDRPQGADLDQRLSVMLDDAGEPEPPAQGDDLARAVDELLEQAATGTEGTSNGAASPAPPATIESLDAQLASLADEMIAGDLTDESGEIVETAEAERSPVVRAGVSTSAPEALADERNAGEPDTDQQGAGEPGEGEPAVDGPEAGPSLREPVFQRVVTPGSRATMPENPAKSESDGQAHAEAPPSEPSQGAPVPGAAAVGPPPAPGTTVAVANIAAPAGRRRRGPLASAAAWVRARPERRQLLAWAAAVTLFNAACLWVYLLVFRDQSAALAAPDEPAADKASASAAHERGDDH